MAKRRILKKMASRDFFVFLKQQFNNTPLCGVEIGVKQGENAQNILTFLNIKKLYLVDIWLAYTNNATKAEIKGGYTDQKVMDSWYQNTIQKFKDNDKVHIIRKTSTNAAKILSVDFDFIYIDANHTYDDVLNDCTIWFPKLQNGGFLGGHDYFNQTTQVKKAIDTFATMIHKTVNTKGDDWWLI